MGVGHQCSHLTMHSTEVESNLVNVLLAITALLFAATSLSLIAAYGFTCPVPNLPS